MRKRGPGLLRSGLGIFLLGLWGMGTWAEEGASSATEQPVPDYKAKVAARIAEWKTAPVEDIEQAVLRSEVLIQQLNDEARAARLATRDLHEKLRMENPEVRAKYREIEEMRARINAFIEELPEMQAPMAAMEEAKSRLMEEVWFRTEAMALVASKDRADGFPERVEPVLEEPEAEAGTPEPAVSAMPEQKEDLEP